MVFSPSILYSAERRDMVRDRRRQIRDRLLCILADAGEAMTPARLAQRAGIGVCAVVRCVHAWPSYFAVDHVGGDAKPRAVLIDRHPHLVRHL